MPPIHHYTHPGDLSLDPFCGSGMTGVLSLMRGMDRLALDLCTHPEAVKQGVDVISDTWVVLMDHAHQKTAAVNHDGILAWLRPWAPGRFDQIACDFSSVISLLREFFLPENGEDGSGYLTVPNGTQIFADSG